MFFFTFLPVVAGHQTIHLCSPMEGHLKGVYHDTEKQ